jgi:hypothetical protein
MRRGATLLICACVLALPTGARAAAPPQVLSTWVTEVTASSAILRAEVNPERLATTYRFRFLPESAFDANLAAGREGFAGSTAVPSAGGSAGSEATPQRLVARLTGLAAATPYRYQVDVENSAGPAQGSLLRLETEESAPIFSLPDVRGWEMVSPADKGGGAIEAPGQLLGGGLMQAAAQGGSLTYSSASSFAAGPRGAPAASQYISTRGDEAWSTANVTSPQSSEAEPRTGAGVPYRAFSANLGEALMYGGGDCLAPQRGCADPSPPLPGSGAPPGYQDYYLRDDSTGAYTALITAADATLEVPAEALELKLAGATPDLRHIVLSTCAALTAEASEEKEGDGCDPADPNLYEWDEGSLTLVNRVGGGVSPLPRARLAAPQGEISADGRRIYWQDPADGDLWLSEAGQDASLVAAGASFQAPAADGSSAFYTEGSPGQEDLYRYDAAGRSSQLIAAEVEGVLGASADGAVVYYQAAGGLYRWDDGSLTEIAAGAGAAEEADWPPATGTARVSADGSVLAFASREEPTGVDDTDSLSGEADSELYVYDAATSTLTCASCDPTGERPVGSSWLPGALLNGEGELATPLYKPRALSADGTRLFFDSEDHLALQDTNERSDVYEWEAPGHGSCLAPSLVDSGCVDLISSGRDGEASEFIDASEAGADAFFRTAASLVPTDPGSYDLYDAREGGGFPVAPTPIPCDGDACQPLPSPPEDPAPGTLVPSPGNPAAKVVETGGRHKHKHRKKKRHHKTKRLHHKRQHQRAAGHRRRAHK